MKKTLLIALLALSLTGFGQIANVVIQTDTLVNGSKFIYTYQGDFRVYVADSVDPNGVTLPGYISLINSRAEIGIKRLRVVNGDTITKYEGVSVPLSAIAPKYSVLINSSVFKQAFKKAIKANSLTRRLNQE